MPSTEHGLLAALESLPRLLQAILRHVFAYGELLCEESIEAVQRARRRVIGIAVAYTAGVMAVALGCLWVIAATWNGPNRLTAVGGLCIGFILIAIIGGAYAIGARGRAGAFAQLRVEWRADMQEIARLDPTLVAQTSTPVMGASSAGPH